MNPIITTCCLATMTLTQSTEPQLAQPLKEYSWLLGTWQYDRRTYLTDGGDSYLKFASDVRIRPDDDGQALLINYALEGSFAALLGVDVTVTERVTVDAKTGQLRGKVTISDRLSAPHSPGPQEAKGWSTYDLAPVAANVWKGDSNGKHRDKPTHSTMQVTREGDDTLIVAITNRVDQNPAGRGDLLVKLKRAARPPEPAR